MTMDPACVILTPRRNAGGRPRLDDEPLTTISTRLPIPEAEYLMRVAIREDMSVSALVRELLVVTVRMHVAGQRFRKKA